MVAQIKQYLVLFFGTVLKTFLKLVTIYFLMFPLLFFTYLANSITTVNGLQVVLYQLLHLTIAVL